MHQAPTNQCIGITATRLKRTQLAVSPTIIPSTAQSPPLLVLLVLKMQPQVDDQVLLELSQLPGLRSLSLTACTGITDSGVTSLAAAKPPLEQVCLDECHQLQDASLVALAGGCQRLKALSVRRCSKMTDEGLVAVAGNGCLQQLSVSGVHGVSSRTVQALATHCMGCLEVLDISFCTGVLEGALGAAVDACTALHTLRVFGCSQLTQRFLYGHTNEQLQVQGVSTSCSCAG